MAIPKHCPICNTSHDNQVVVTSQVYGDSGQRAFFKCTVCDVIYLYPQLNDEEEKKFYAKEFEGFMEKRSSLDAGWEGPERHVKANQQQFERRWKYLDKQLPKAGKILEIGCSSGFMLYPLVEKGFECFGIEPSGVFSDFVRSRGITVYPEINSPALKKDYFDVIMHFFVLEHVKNPGQFIEGNLKLLKKNGKLILEIPNAADPLYTVYDVPAFERFYWSIAHHWYFTEKSIRYLLDAKKNQYALIRDQRYDLSNHMIWARDGKPGGMGKFTNKIGLETEEAYKSALIKSGFCDTLVVVISKNE